MATNFETIPPTINPNDHANKLASPEMKVTKAYACICDVGYDPTFDKIFSTGFVCANACAVIIIIQICAVKVNSLGRPVPHASKVSIIVESVLRTAKRKVNTDKTITKIKASG